MLRNRTPVFVGGSARGGVKAPVLWDGILSDIKETSPKKQREAGSACPQRAAGSVLRGCVIIPTFLLLKMFE